MRRIFALSVLLSLVEALSLLALPSAFTYAQAAAYAEIASVEASGFPKITALMDVYTADGRFMTGLQPSNVTAYEDGQSHSLDTLSESVVPVELVVAVNPGPGLAVRDGNAIQRFSRAVEALSQWVNSQPSDSSDDLSLVSLSGSLITHANAKDWFVSLDSFKPDFRNTTPNLQTFSIALDTVTATTPQPGMKRAILFITPHMDDPNIDNTIEPLIQRAIESKVRVFVWFVDAESYFPTASANAFKSLALQTNGSYFAFSGKEMFPDLSIDLAPLRHIYTLTYTSSLKKAGDHTFGVAVESSQETIHTPDQTFSVDIQPPNPIFVSPPLQIKRQPSAEDPYNGEALLPAQQKIEILVEFPDEHPRALKRTTLYVDGQVVDENTSKPFETFTWDLNVYEKSGQHEIIVEAEDNLGLKKSSMGIPVTLTVIQPPRGIQALLGRFRSYLILGAIGLAGIALLIILVTGRSGGELFKKRRQKRKRFEDPLTQPVVALTEPPTSPIKKSKTIPRRSGWLQSKTPRVPEAPAYLRRLANGSEPASALPIPILERDMTFGTDPVQCKYVLDDPSISPLHARIKQTADGNFLIYDHGSIAGTWVNYEPVTREGYRLAHGDRIHFGQLMYRFDLNRPPAEPEPTVVSKKSTL
ncbi:MAG TPA: FHA domain-containing protein [Anaerolineales bacterium]|nr:FHA domain-containing protein [Anaerolineales bacterium]